MGYDVKRFIGEIDDEFLCPICRMVLDNPVQSPCEHIFCNECIKEWLSSECSCPVDRKSLQVDDLKLAARYFRNMLDKLEMKCDFELKGCGNIVKLEHLKDHIKDCEYNPNGEVVCDKGCNLKITRQEYRINNCFSHLASQLSCKDVEVSELRQELSDLKSSIKLNFECKLQDYAKNEETLELRQQLTELKSSIESSNLQEYANQKKILELKQELSDLKSSVKLNVESKQQKFAKDEVISEILEELSKLKVKFDRQEGDTVELKEKLLRQEEQFNKEVNELRKTIGKLCYKCNVFEMPQKWGTNLGMKFHSENQNILESGADPTLSFAFAYSLYVLNPESNSFKIEILDILNTTAAISIMINRIYYESDGSIHLGEGEGKGKKKWNSRKWKVGDIVEGGIKFPKNFIDDGTNSANVEANIYFSLNGEIIFESPVKIPSVGLYTEVCMMGSGNKIKYLQLK